MSVTKIRASLETALKAVQPPLSIVWENKEGPNGSPYEEVWLMLAKPENPTQGDNFYRQRGYLQVKLKYPLNEGPGDAGERAELLRTTFRRGLSWTNGGVTTTVEETPEIGNGSYEDDKYVVPVFIRFFANVQPS